MPTRRRPSVCLRRLTEDEIQKWTKSRNYFSSSSTNETFTKTRRDACSSEFKRMQSALVDEIDSNNETIKVNVEEGSVEQVEILEPLEPTFLCTICGTTHSKNFSCSNYGIFKTEVFLCPNQECGKTFESELDLEQHGNSCQVSDPLLIETATFQDEDIQYLRKSKTTKCINSGQSVTRSIDHVGNLHPDKVSKSTFANRKKPFVSKNKLTKHLLQLPSSFKCAYCKKVFDRKNVYLKHVYNYHKNCSKCSFRGCILFFKSQLKMEKHYKKNHPFKAKCDMCGYLSPSLKVLRQHMMRKHFSHKRNKCKYCGSCAKNMRLHLLASHPEIMLELTQTSCCKDFTTEIDLQNHRIQAHGAIKCTLCGKVFEQRYLYNNHVNITHHREKLVKCTFRGCIHFFKSHVDMEEHLTENHSIQAQNAIKCIFCDKTFVKKCMYILHVKNSHQGQKLFKCSFKGCIHFFKSQFEMEKHYKESHPFQGKCDQCGYLAPSSKALLTHMKRNHHYPTFAKKIVNNEEKTECSFCGKFFDKINVHMGIVNPEQIAVRPCKSATTYTLHTEFPQPKLQNSNPQAHDALKCIFCGKVFSDKILYITHVYNLHASEQPLKCFFTGCIHFFQSRPEMEKHYKENHPLQAQCNLCGYFAPTLKNIAKHMQIMHYLTCPELRKNCTLFEMHPPASNGHPQVG